MECHRATFYASKSHWMSMTFLELKSQSNNKEQKCSYNTLLAIPIGPKTKDGEIPFSCRCWKTTQHFCYDEDGSLRLFLKSNTLCKREHRKWEWLNPFVLSTKPEKKRIRNWLQQETGIFIREWMNVRIFHACPCLRFVIRMTKTRLNCFIS